MFNEREKIDLMSDVKVIKTCVEDMKPQVKANTRFRWMVMGFCGIGVPSIYLIMAITKTIFEGS